MTVLSEVTRSLASVPGYMLGRPGPSGFSSATRAQSISQKFSGDIKGRTYVITGCNTGIGKETMRVIAGAGGVVVMACRSQEKMDKAKAEVVEEFPEAIIHTLILDLNSLDSVRGAVEEFGKMGLPLHCLINNAGVMFVEPGTTQDGVEVHFGLNVLGHHVLTMGLLPLLEASGTEEAPSRVVTVSSEAHMGLDMQFGDMNLEKCKWKGFLAYGHSKLGNILTTRALQLHLKAKGSRVVATCCHPGVIQTEIGRNMTKLMYSVFYTICRPFSKTAPQGAATTVYLAVAPIPDAGQPSPAYSPGGYHADCNPSFSSDNSIDDARAAKLWAILPQLESDPKRADFSEVAPATFD